MGIHPRSIPSFFRVFMEDFAHTLHMPAAFLIHFPGDYLPETMTIVSAQPKQRRTWHVAMEVTEDGYFFTDGWSKCVHDLNLCFGDFLFFWLIGESTLEVLPCGHNCCPKPLTHQPRHVSRKHQNVSAAAGPSKEVSFETNMRKYNNHILCLPQWFAKRSGLGNEKWVEKWVTLVDPKGRKWRVKVRPREDEMGRTYRTDLGKGWSDFREANELVDGVVCCFRLVGTKIHVSVT